MLRKQYGEKKVYFSFLFYITVYHWKKPRYDFKQGNGIDYGGVLLNSLILMAGFCFLIATKTICSGKSPLTVIQILQHQTSMKKINIRLAQSVVGETSREWQEHFLNWDAVFHNDYILGRVNIKLNLTIYLSDSSIIILPLLTVSATQIDFILRNHFLCTLMQKCLLIY